ncbi:unnamed protein product [Parascedosporium putredinis]|uniref:Ysc84 actin-binding domain-containing protein n=1 Tax=Parascedosporium putredinis TaxID=1442378 RepID=A0A9P1HEG5_9PEZI|nr:unnamed protein product [Parascedosporium putredinis]CAI8004972.1 unnamed protein product [Parascedosporium putredinis]
MGDEKAQAAERAIGEQQYFPPPPPGPPRAGRPDEFPQQPQYTHDAAYNPRRTAPEPSPADDVGRGGGRRTGALPPPPLQQQHQQHPDEHPIPEYNPATYHAAGQAYNAPPADLHADLVDEEDKKHGKSRAGWSSKMHQLGAKAAGPINALANKMGSQAFLPSTMDKECEKAAAILTSFCRIQKEGHRRSRSKDRALLRIPGKVLHGAVGLAIFTTARVGFQFSAATGSGVLIARLPDGSWSPPSGIQVHTLGAGFMAGVDIYDCVCVINSPAALEAFMRTRVSLGSEIAVAAGPFGAGGKLDIGAGPYEPAEKAPVAQPGVGAIPGAAPVDPTKLTADGQQKPAPGHRRSSSLKSLSPVFTYIKSRGLWAGIHADGTVITERKEANHAFYGHKVSVKQILRAEGLVPQEAAIQWPRAAGVLLDALKKAEARREDGEEEIIVPPATVVPAVAHPPPAAAHAPVDPAHGSYYKADEAMASGGVRSDVLPPYEGPGSAYSGAGDQKGAGQGPPPTYQ